MNYSDKEYAAKVEKSIYELKLNLATLPLRTQVSDMEAMEAVCRENYTEIIKLHELLNDAGITHLFVFDPENVGFELGYVENGEVVCSACTHSFSYGHENGLIEIMGLLTPEELKRDEVAGWLTAEDVFQRIVNYIERIGNKE